MIFNVVNKGKISHDFKIGGKKTRNLRPGKSAKLTVKFTKKGRYAYLCTIPGHAGPGMKGDFRRGRSATAAASARRRPTTTTTTPANVGTANTTVNVDMVEYAFQLSQSTIPSGQVTFVIKNNGNEVHNFEIIGVTAAHCSRRAPPRPGRSRCRRVSTSTLRRPVPCRPRHDGHFQVTP